MNYISIYDLILLPLYLSIVYFFAFRKKNKHILNEPNYKYYLTGLTIKILGGVGLCLVYTLYYKTGGDTLNYFDSGIVMLKLLGKSPSAFLDIIINGNKTDEQFSIFDSSTGWPCYWPDKNSFFLIRLTCLLIFVSLKSYLITTVLLAWITYSGIWRLYTVFCKEFPLIKRDLAIALLFIPSVAFWGSGLLKDTITYSACCWFTVAFYNGVVKRRGLLKNLIIILISCYLILSIKPYILYCLIPGSAIWMISAFTSEVKSVVIKSLVFPLILLIVSGSGYLIFKSIGNNLGKWSVDEVLERAVITQSDLVKDYYGGNTFDIGKFNATLPSMLSKAPIAIVAGLFRPFIWEARNPVMIVSGLENAFFMLMSLFLIVKLKVYNILILAWKNPLLLYSLVFALFFAFMVGLTTPNFGSLVRYRIPAIPFFLSALFILKYYYNKKSIDKTL